MCCAQYSMQAAEQRLKVCLLLCALIIVSMLYGLCNHIRTLAMENDTSLLRRMKTILTMESPLKMKYVSIRERLSFKLIYATLIILNWVQIKCAPWNTTRAFLSSMRGKCLLDQNGIADPSGCGQGFSYIRVSQKPQKVSIAWLWVYIRQCNNLIVFSFQQDDTPSLPKRLVTGTNADLRKLPLKEAKEICRGYGVKEDEVCIPF